MKKKDRRGWLYRLVEVYSTMTQQYTLKMSVHKEVKKHSLHSHSIHFGFVKPHRIDFQPRINGSAKSAWRQERAR